MDPGRTALKFSLIRRLSFCGTSEDESSPKTIVKTSSPRHTRSGRIYSTERKGARKQRPRLSLIKCVEDGDAGDCDTCEDEAEEDCPSVKMTPKMDRSRLFCHRAAPGHADLTSSPHPLRPTILFSPSLPQSSPFCPQMGFGRCLSPNFSNLSTLNILESPSIACSVGRKSRAETELPPRVKSRLFLNNSDFGGSSRFGSFPKVNISDAANVNPFTPLSKRIIDTSSQSEDEVVSESQEGGDGDGVQEMKLPAKRIRVSDMNVARYQDEFLEMGVIASGQFGDVMQARHRLDGVIYAVKIIKKKLKPNSREERIALNEVFAHAAMMKHKHVVRYFNAWVESGRLYIQNEFCEGGNLNGKIEYCRLNQIYFVEPELRKILVQVSRGLQYIHGKKLVHLDIKPENILIAYTDEEMVSPNNLSMSPDSGAASGDCALIPVSEYGPTEDCVRYKIGDLGHVVAVQNSMALEGGSEFLEEGDCRYMAPEFLSMENVPKHQLPKSDMFSTGLAIYEAASLLRLPKNSEDGGEAYFDLKAGRLAPIPRYTYELHNILSNLVHPDPSQRPTASRLLSNPALNPSATKSKAQLRRELRIQREKIVELEQELQRSGKLLVGKGTPKTTSAMF